MSRVTISATGFLAVLLSVTTAAASTDATRWTRVEADRFGVFSTATDARTLRVARDLDTFRGAIRSDLSVCEAAERLPTHVFVAGSTSTFLHYWPDQKGAGGFFLSSELANYIAVNASPGLIYGTIVFHEYVHHVLHNCYPGLPLWLEEGLAEYFGTFSIDGDTARIGDPVDDHLDWLRSNAWLPLTRVLTMSQGSPGYDETDRAGGFYAQAWLLIHYLLENRHPQSLIGLVMTADEPDRAVFDILQADVGDVERALRAYASRRSLPRFERTVGELSTAAFVRTTPATPGAALTRIAEMEALARGKLDTAERLFRAALDAAPDRADAQAGLAYALALSGKTAEAAAGFDAAVSAAPGDAQIATLRGKAHLDRARRLQGEADRGEAFRASREEARRWFSRAIELDADLWVAHADLGATYVLDEVDPAPGIAALERARELFPAKMHVAANLAMLYARAGRLADSEAVMRELERRSRDTPLFRQTQHSVQRARYNYNVGRYNEAVVLLNEGKLADGVKILEEIEPGVEDSELEARVREILTRARSRAEP